MVDLRERITQSAQRGETLCGKCWCPCDTGVNDGMTTECCDDEPVLAKTAQRLLDALEQDGGHAKGFP